MKKQRVVYFGSPEFSLPPLKTLYLGEYEIVGIYTQEPKKKFRGQKNIIHQFRNGQRANSFQFLLLKHLTINL